MEKCEVKVTPRDSRMILYNFKFSNKDSAFDFAKNNCRGDWVTIAERKNGEENVLFDGIM